MRDFLWSFPDGETLEQQYGKSITGMKLTCDYCGASKVNHNLIENKVPGLVTLYPFDIQYDYNTQHLYTDLSPMDSREITKYQYVDDKLYNLKKKVSFSNKLS